MPWQSPVHGVGVEARAPVAHEHVHRALGGLHEHRDGGAARPPGRVGHGLSRGGHQRLHGRVEGGVSHDHHVHHHAVPVLHHPGETLDRGPDRGLVGLGCRRRRANSSAPAPGVSPAPTCAPGRRSAARGPGSAAPSRGGGRPCWPSRRPGSGAGAPRAGLSAAPPPTVRRSAPGRPLPARPTAARRGWPTGRGVCRRRPRFRVRAARCRPRSSSPRSGRTRRRAGPSRRRLRARRPRTGRAISPCPAGPRPGAGRTGPCPARSAPVPRLAARPSPPGSHAPQPPTGPASPRGTAGGGSTQPGRRSRPPRPGRGPRRRS